MSADEDTELRDLIVQTLETNGVIGKIKAELRASVFLALEEEGSFRDKIPLVNKKLSDFLLTSEGKVALSLVREFLDFFNLNFTMAVFDPEVACTFGYMTRKELVEHCRLDSLNFDTPLILQLLKTSSKPLPTELNYSTPIHNQSNDTAIGLGLNKGPVPSSRGFLDNLDDKHQTPNYDSFFDEPLPPNISPITNLLFNKESSGSEMPKQNFGMSSNQTDHKTGGEIGSFQNYLKNKQVNDNASKLEKEENLFSSDNRLLDKKEQSIFAKKAENVGFLRDLPPLNSKLPLDSDWRSNKTHKKGLPSLKPDLEQKDRFDLDLKAKFNSEQKDRLDEEISVTSEQSSKSSVKSTEQKLKSEVSDASEQSIEEELEEEISGVDDLLSSISVGEDSTSDHTVSTIGATGYDYIEKCHPKK